MSRSNTKLINGKINVHTLYEWNNHQQHYIHHDETQLLVPRFNSDKGGIVHENRIQRNDQKDQHGGGQVRKNERD